MADKLSCVNLALAHLGEPQILSLVPAQLTGAAKKVLAFAEQARDALLERHDWLLAGRFVTLQPSNLGAIDADADADTNPDDIGGEGDEDGDEGAGDWNYANVFELPADFLRLITVPDRSVAATPGLTYFTSTALFPMASRWRLGTADKAGVTVKVVYSDDAGPLRISYVRRLDWGAMSPSMIDALALDMAARACRPINGDADLAAGLKKAAEAQILVAMGVDGMQAGSEDPEIMDTFNQLRLTSR